MIIVHVDDMLWATNDSHQVESHTSRFLRTYDVSDCKRADSDEGSCIVGKRVRTVPDDVTPGGLALRQQENPRDAKYDRELALADRRDTP